uniref:Uncharacterized protein n=1 Tax=Heterorhabditis bacteriophora TaxID=37862 RepID=A0A1I7X4L7_HETBA
MTPDCHAAGIILNKRECRLYLI